MWPNKDWLSWKCPAAIHMGSGWLSAGSHFLQKRRRGYRYYKNSRAKSCTAVGSDSIKCHHYINNTSVTKSHSPGATKTSCFLERMRRKVRSFWGSMSLTVLLAIIVRLRRSPAYWTAVELSKVVLMGIPEKIKTAQSDSILDMLHQRKLQCLTCMHACLPSALTTIVPITPLWASILFSVSSTSACRTKWNQRNTNDNNSIYYYIILYYIGFLTKAPTYDSATKTVINNIFKRVDFTSDKLSYS